MAGPDVILLPLPRFLMQSEGSEARALGLPSRIDPDRATGVAFADRQVRHAANEFCRGLARAPSDRNGCCCRPWVRG